MSFTLGKHWRQICLSLGFLLCGGILLFARLGHYALWDDEAMTALIAKGILRTGDTSVFPDDHNIVAYRNGLLVKNGFDRSTPPLATYLTAVSFALFGQSSFTARLPASLFGLATLAFVAWWLWRARKPLFVQFLYMLGFLGNVSLLLFSRQCRYYAPAIFFTVLGVYAYLHCRNNPWRLFAFSLICVLLFASSYLAYAALGVCLAVDYLIWRRHECPLRIRDFAILLLPQLILIGLLAFTWNPLATNFGAYGAKNSLMDRVVLFFWNIRDMNLCEFFVGTLIVLAPLVGFLRKKPVLLRLCLALLVYIVFVTIVSPQVKIATYFGDVRYLVALIPLCIAIEVETMLVLLPRQKLLITSLALIAFGTNLLQGGPFLSFGARGTFASFVGELIRPPLDPYRAISHWMEKYAKPDASVAILPDYMAYPLMFHNPTATYAWQFEEPPAKAFRNLPDIHVLGRAAPDYIIVCGPGVSDFPPIRTYWKERGVQYRFAVTIDTYWCDLFRPEFMWRQFSQKSDYDPGTEAIYVFQKVSVNHSR